MPYFDHQMATSISDNSSGSDNNTSTMKRKVLRTVAQCSKPTSNMSSKKPDINITSQYKVDLDLRKLMFLRNLLKAEIETIQKQKGAIPDSNENYKNYSYALNKVLVQGKDSVLYEAKNNDYPELPLCCRLYENKKISIEKNALYLRILRHLGKKHNSIVQTWDIFLSKHGNLEIFQEYCSVGNLDQFVRNNDSLSEKQISLYTWQLLKGMDFLGDIGISHRDIQPKNIVLRPANKDNFLKITNFRKAIIYWSIQDNDVIYVPCLNARNQVKDGENFQAPECYGDPDKEEFDPIIADTWSFGACIYFMVSKQYPYKVKKQIDDLEKEIQDNVDEADLTDDGKDLLKALLRSDASERMPIGHVEKSQWFKDAKQSKLKVVQTPSTAPVKKPSVQKQDFFKSNVFARAEDYESVSASTSEKSEPAPTISKREKSKTKSKSFVSKKSVATSAKFKSPKSMTKSKAVSTKSKSKTKTINESSEKDDDSMMEKSLKDGPSGKDGSSMSESMKTKMLESTKNDISMAEKSFKEGDSISESTKDGSSVYESMKSGKSMSESTKSGKSMYESFKGGKSLTESLAESTSNSTSIKNDLSMAEKSFKEGESMSESVSAKETASISEAKPAKGSKAKAKSKSKSKIKNKSESVSTKDASSISESVSDTTSAKSDLSMAEKSFKEGDSMSEAASAKETASISEAKPAKGSKAKAKSKSKSKIKNKSESVSTKNESSMSESKSESVSTKDTSSVSESVSDTTSAKSDLSMAEKSFKEGDSMSEAASAKDGSSLSEALKDSATIASDCKAGKSMASKVSKSTKDGGGKPKSKSKSKSKSKPQNKKDKKKR